MKRSLGYLLFIFSVWFIFTEYACKPKDPDVIHVSLKRNDSELLAVGMGFSFDEKRVAEALEKYKPRLPDPLPANTQITFSHVGPFFGLLEKEDDQQQVY
ncbi:MAG: hypothetical protein KAU46_11190 [Candidatus Aminicenantes bacterium]|nr:hypothetical protein [Candidatus Aminicenantes bacterium]